MRINAEMTGVRSEVARRTLNGETYQRGAGTFTMDGVALSRSTVQEAKAEDTTKYLLCGTCGMLLSFNNLTNCKRCKQLPPPDDYFMAQIAKDWQRRRIDLQSGQHSPIVRRKNLTDDCSTVTSAAETYLIAEEQYAMEVKLSLSERREPSYHKLSAPVDPGFKYRKFLSGMGMQEPWEKVYSQGDRLWLPSRANMSRQSHITHDKVQIDGNPSIGKEIRQHGPQDKPHHIRTFPGFSKTFKVGLKRPPSKY